MEIVWREVALNSLERARTYIAQDNPDNALAFILALEEQIAI